MQIDKYTEIYLQKIILHRKKYNIKRNGNTRIFRTYQLNMHININVVLPLIH